MHVCVVVVVAVFVSFVNNSAYSRPGKFNFFRFGDNKISLMQIDFCKLVFIMFHELLL